MDPSDRLRRRAGAPNAAATAGHGGPSQPTAAGAMRATGSVPSSDLTRALGPPDPRPGHLGPGLAVDDAAGAGAGERRDADARLSRGARRMLGELPPEPVSLYTRVGRRPRRHVERFDIDISQRVAAVAGRRRRTARTTPRRCSRRGPTRSSSGPRAPCRCRRSTPVDARRATARRRSDARRRTPRRRRARAQSVGPGLRHRRPRLHAASAA